MYKIYGQHVWTTLSICFLCLVMNCNANSATLEHHKSHGKAYGIHGMALFSDGTQFFASHMPLANSIHAHQVIFTFELPEKDKGTLATLLAEKFLVSFLPERFDLMRLLSGEITEIKGSIYKGHFERGGKVIGHNVTMKVSSLLLNQPLNNAGENGHYYLINTKKNEALLVHRIVANPSFDHIVQIKLAPITSETLTKNQPTEVNVLSLIQLTNGQPLFVEQSSVFPEFHQVFNGLKTLYIETRDFR